MLLLRLKQLYDKFDDVVASGRMIAKVSETTDGSALSSLANGKKKEFNNIMYYRYEKYVSAKAFTVYYSSTFARVYVYIYIFMCNSSMYKKKKFVVDVFLRFLFHSNTLHVRDKEKE